MYENMQAQQYSVFFVSNSEGVVVNINLFYPIMIKTIHRCKISSNPFQIRCSRDLGFGITSCSLVSFCGIQICSSFLWSNMFNVAMDLSRDAWSALLLQPSQVSAAGLYHHSFVRQCFPCVLTWAPSPAGSCAAHGFICTKFADCLWVLPLGFITLVVLLFCCVWLLLAHITTHSQVI